MSTNHDAVNDSRIRGPITLTLAIVILAFSLWGFGSKFIEFVVLARGDVEGVFAVTPVVNYLLASLGFLCLFGWAAANGMFRDIERPKQSMLDIEEQLDHPTSRSQSNPPNEERQT